MGLGNVLSKIGRKAAAVRLSMHGYTPERLEAERELLAEFRAEREAERARKARADARAEEAAARAEEAAQEAQAERERSRAVAAATALAQSTAGDEPEFLSTLAPEQADLLGIKPEQQDAVLAIGRRLVQARRDEEKRKREQALADRAAARTEADAAFERHARFNDSLIRGRRPAPNPKLVKDQDYLEAWRAVSATRDPDEPETDPLAFQAKVEEIYPVIKARRLAREGKAPATPEANPFADLLGGLFGGRPAITSPGQPVKRRKYDVQVLP